MKIKQAEIEDIEDLAKVALTTAIGGKDGTDYFYNKNAVSQYFCEPYIKYDNQYCFDVVENDICEGYTVGAVDSKDFFAWFNESWLPSLREIYSGCQIKTKEEKDIIDLINKDVENSSFFEEYPAHLHINLSKNLQGKKIGSKLINTLLDKFAEQGVKGVHLGVDIKNDRAIGFYRHLGFEIIESHSWGHVMGKKISK